MGDMATEETQLLLQVKNAGDRYVDISQALTTVNKKQYHQTSSKGVPLCYAFTLQVIHSDGSMPVLTLPRTWVVRNSVVKLAAGWKKQLKDAGFRMKDLSPYGRRLRLGFDDNAVASDGTAANFIQPYHQKSISSDGVPVPVFETYDSPGVDDITYQMAAEVTTIVVPSDTEGSAPMEMPAVVLSASTGVVTDIFRAVGQYLRSRNVMREDQAPADSSLDPSNYLVRLFSGAQPETDEIITEAQDFQEVRPYSMEIDDSLNFAAEFETSTFPQITQNAGGGEISVYSGVAPLGLLCLGDIDGSGSTTSAFDQFLLTVHAVYEM